MVRYIRAVNLLHYNSKAPYERAALWNERATNADLQRYVIDATRAAWPHIDWPRNIPRKDVPATVHAFAQQAVQYVREDGDQLTRLPWRTVEDGIGDCKSLSVLVASLARAAGCSVVLRFAQYPGDDHYGHVYAVVDGIVCDPELRLGDEVKAENYHSVRV